MLKLYQSKEGIRGIGITTNEALYRLLSGVNWKKSGRRGEHAAGNGTAMRIAPIGLFYYLHLDALKKYCTEASIITHNNIEAINGAIAVAYASDLYPKI